MTTVILALDVFAMLSAIGAALLWFAASRRRLRRVSYREVLDAADLNRIVVGINRTQILNARAALATSISAFAVAVRLGLDSLRIVG